MSAIIPKVSYLSKNIIRVLGCNPSPMTLQGTNTYIIGTGKRRILFDTGEKQNVEYLSNLCKVLKENNCGLDTIIISHWHHDHIGGLEDVLNAAAANSGSEIRVLKLRRREEADSIPPAASALVKWLEGGEKIRVDGATVQVHHTPGHTTDHVVLRLEEDGSVFSGDCILGEGTAVFEDLYHYMKSLQAILDMGPTAIYPGHGPVIADPVERIRYYIAHRNGREAQILGALERHPEAGLTPLALVALIYKDTPSHLHPAAAGNVLHHLKKLEKERKIICVDGESSTWKRVKLNSTL